MKRTATSSRIIPLTAAVGAAALLALSAAHAGDGPGGCVYGHGAEQMASDTAEQTPLLADQSQDPKWLALQKRLQLEAQSAEEVITVPN